MRARVLIVLLITGLLLVGCGPAIMPAEAPQTESGETFIVALPRIVVTFDADGKPGFEGVPVEDIAQALGANLDLSSYRINPFYPQWMTSTDVQHIELRQTGEGVAVLVNSKLMPSLSFKDGSLEKLADVAPLLGEQGQAMAEMVRKFAPIVKRLGLSIVLKFPMKEGAEPIVYADPTVKLAAMTPSTEPASAVVQFEVRYDEQGIPSILGISARDLAAIGVQAPLALAPDYLNLVKANNVQHIQLRTKAEGVWVYVNGTALPNIAWDNQTIGNALSVYEQMNPGVPENWLELIRTFVPMLSRSDISIMMHFPLASGVEPIAAEMQ